jgi:hypothetical protein
VLTSGQVASLSPWQSCYRSLYLGVLEFAVQVHLQVLAALLERGTLFRQPLDELCLFQGASESDVMESK